MDPETEDTVGQSFSVASGASYQDCFVIAQRYRETVGFKPPDGESWVVLQAPDRTETLFFKRGWYTGLWRSTSGAAYVSDAGGAIHRLPPSAADARAASWIKDKIPATLMGVWGLDDECVFTWGLGEGARPVAYRWDGSRWTETPRLDRAIVAMHGLRRDCVFAVGAEGLVAWYDGGGWREMGGVSRELTLGSVAFVSDDEVYAGSPDGALLRGSVHGWTSLFEGGEPIGSVARWRDEIWIGSLGVSGLSKLDGRTLIPIKPNLRALKLDSRDELLLCTLDAVVSTNDGVRFAGRTAADFGQLLKDKRLAWR